MLENLISAPVAVGLVLARRRLPFSATSWILVVTFLALHEVGSHYTYSRVPWMEWSRDLLGWAPGWERNHYDRFLHLAFGLLLTLPIRELVAARLNASPALLRLIPVCVVLSCSGVYEIVEWVAAWVVDPELGIAFVGAQGDVWDAQKDTSLALGGSCLVTAIAWAADRWLRTPASKEHSTWRTHGRPAAEVSGLTPETRRPSDASPAAPAA